jgi:hypothetical protein
MLYTKTLNASTWFILFFYSPLFNTCKNIGDLYFGWWHLHITLEQKSKVLEVLIWISKVERVENVIVVDWEQATTLLWTLKLFICFTLIVI